MNITRTVAAEMQAAVDGAVAAGASGQRDAVAVALEAAVREAFPVEFADLDDAAAVPDLRCRRQFGTLAAPLDQLVVARVAVVDWLYMTAWLEPYSRPARTEASSPIADRPATTPTTSSNTPAQTAVSQWARRAVMRGC